MMTTTAIEVVARRWYEDVLSQGNLAVIDEIFSPDFVEHDPRNPGQGLDGVRMLVMGYRSAFPDLRVTVEDMVGDGAKMAVRFTAAGTHQGAFLGIPPTGRAMQVGNIDILGFRGGKISEHWGEGDMLGLLQQLGVIPVPGQ
jgi:steroid delta-isomerase-like uncharacterized protein